MKYKVFVPKAPKNMQGKSQLRVTLSDSYFMSEDQFYDLDGHAFFEFEVPDKFEWMNNGASIKDYIFDVSVVHTNSKADKTKEIRLVPEKVV